jgi:hypothetical protein
MTNPAGTLEALSEEPCTCHEMGPDRIGPWDCPHHGRVDAARERPGVGLREALEREHYGNLVTHTPDFGHSHPGMFSDRCGICAAKSECPSCAALGAAPVAPDPAVSRVASMTGTHECWDGDNFIERHPELLDREDVLAALDATPEARSPRHETLRDGLREALQMRWGHELPPDDQPNWDYEARILIVRLTDHGYLPAAYAEGGEGE